VLDSGGRRDGDGSGRALCHACRCGDDAVDREGLNIDVWTIEAKDNGQEAFAPSNSIAGLRALLRPSFMARASRPWPTPWTAAVGSGRTECQRRGFAT
jgi:hypothetical protein